MMIQANELRIGNYILLEGIHYAEVSAIAENAITTVNPNNKYLDGTSGDIWVPKSDYLSGIPLTPEILEACGFKKDNISHKFHRASGAFPTISWARKDEWLIEGLPVDCVNFKYLHQLQNLFFALTASELPVNLPVKNLL